MSVAGFTLEGFPLISYFESGIGNEGRPSHWDPDDKKPDRGYNLPYSIQKEKKRKQFAFSSTLSSNIKGIESRSTTSNVPLSL